MYYVSVQESIKDILITPIGSRVMLPEYGSRLFELVDRKIDDEFRADLTTYVFEAIEKWEPRVRINEVKLKSLIDGRLNIALVLDNNEIVEIAA
ncbi:MAG: GPW/gp25 family protein [Campylobacteraceae bacterium]|jgi:phage baseplate assembly protein W|nr:GPW/gp25 family protein [Campylobacteraceae bacterium]